MHLASGTLSDLNGSSLAESSLNSSCPRMDDFNALDGELVVWYRDLFN